MSAVAAHDASAPLGPLYQGYAYGYPHKGAYRALAPPRRLNSVWSTEAKDRVFLYVHVPFCEMRCGFCNLFTTANPEDSLVERYLAALTREALIASEELGPSRAAQMAIGGGTPTFLDPGAMATLLDLVGRLFGADPARVPASVETSPKTAQAEQIALLSERGVERISIGAQSFFEEETRAMGRPQKTAELEAALDTIRRFPFQRLNIDLIYGAAPQTPETWCASIRRALAWRPEELYLYPLYVRAGTGIHKRAQVEDAHRLALYRAGRDLLLSEGYEQLSMRAFRRPGSQAPSALEYSCQEDGMLGIGAGARSYTRDLHYSTEYAVSRPGVLNILGDYCARDSEAFRYAAHGFELSTDERVRRYVLKSILRREGLEMARFTAVFGESPLAALPPLAQLMSLGLLEERDGFLAPTDAGLEQSDAIAPFLYSARVRHLMQGDPA
jgi:oxygen-independent coproporphyrinogen-3 oxidase